MENCWFFFSFFFFSNCFVFAILIEIECSANSVGNVNNNIIRRSIVCVYVCQMSDRNRSNLNEFYLVKPSQICEYWMKVVFVKWKIMCHNIWIAIIMDYKLWTRRKNIMLFFTVMLTSRLLRKKYLPNQKKKSVYFWKKKKIQRDFMYNFPHLIWCFVIVASDHNNTKGNFCHYHIRTEPFSNWSSDAYDFKRHFIIILLFEVAQKILNKFKAFIVEREKKSFERVVLNYFKDKRYFEVSGAILIDPVDNF